MTRVVYLLAAIAVLAAVAVNMILAVNYNVAKINIVWEERCEEYDSCFKAFDMADAQIEAVCSMWDGECFTIGELCSGMMLQEVRYNILLYGNPFVDVIRKKNLNLCETEERIFMKGLSI